MRVTGTVVRFDRVRGYGFIAPDSGGDDIFLHANDLEFEKSLATRGVRVSFDVEDGPRGELATSVQLVTPRSDHVEHSSPSPASDSDDYFDILAAAQLRHIVTEALLGITPPLTGEQILRVRASFETLAQKYGWTE
ncbi:cold-shock protein [Mycobacterium sp. LTG2003]